MIALALLTAGCLLATEVPAVGDGIDRNDPNFVKASLMVATPGEGILSCVGHVCLRLECPAFKLDNCFSLEHEKAADPFFSVFFEKLKMGLYVIPTAEYLEDFRPEGRGVVQYPLDLPPDLKVRLWQILDTEAEKGADDPYDYVKRSCTVTIVRYLQQAAPPYRLAFPGWDARFLRTRREIFADALDDVPWQRAFLHLVVGTAWDRTTSNLEKLILPSDVVDFLSGTTISGRPVLDRAAAVQVLPLEHPRSGAPLVTPLIVACLLLVLTVASVVFHWSWMTYVLLALQSLIGFFLVYIYGFSHLPAANWNCLLIPFNPLPLVCWRWRRYWRRPFAAALLLWLLAALFSPFAWCDPAYLVLVIACIVRDAAPCVQVGCGGKTEVSCP